MLIGVPLMLGKTFPTGVGMNLQDTKRTLIFIFEDEPGYVTVVKSNSSGQAVFLISFRRLPRDVARKDKEISRLLRKDNGM